LNNHHKTNYKTIDMSEKIVDKVAPGVAAGKDLQEIFRIAKANQFALPATI
jgi:fructose-bisphosphate aldolase class II